MPLPVLFEEPRLENKVLTDDESYIEIPLIVSPLSHNSFFYPIAFSLFLQYFCGIFPYFGYNYEKITISFRFVHILFTIRCYYKNIKESKVTNLLFFHNSPHCPLDNGALLFLSRNFLNVFYLPVNRLQTMCCQISICLTERLTSKKSPVSG